MPRRSLFGWVPSVSQLRASLLTSPVSTSVRDPHSSLAPFRSPAAIRRPSAPPPPLPEPPPPQDSCRALPHSSPPVDANLLCSYKLRRPVDATRRLTAEGRKMQGQRLDAVAKKLTEALEPLLGEADLSLPWLSVEAAIDAFTDQLYETLAPPPLPALQSPRAHQGNEGSQRPRPVLMRTDKAILLAEDAYKRASAQLAALQAQLPKKMKWTKEEWKKVDKLRRRLRRAKRRAEGMKTKATAGKVQYLYRVNRKRCLQQILAPEEDKAPKRCPLPRQQIEDFLKQQQDAPHGYKPEDLRAQKFWDTLHPALEPPPSEDAEEASNSDNLPLTLPFSEEAVLAVLNRSNKTASPGHDGLTYTAYLVHKNILLAPLTLIFNICLRYKHTPASWKRSIITLIPKPGKTNYNDISSWRPISLQPCIAKIYNALLAKRLQSWAIERRQISHSQKGFMPVPGCHEHIFVAHSILNSSKRYRRSVHMAWYDIKDAFGSVAQQHIFKVLQRLGLPEDFLAIIQHEYSGASFQVRTEEGLTSPTLLKKGVKQGCPLSPLLFNFALEPLLRLLETAKDPYLLYGPPSSSRAEDKANRQEAIPVHCLAYADDIKIVSNSAEGLRAHHKIVAEFLEVTGLCANPSKCAVLGVNKVAAKLAPVDYEVELHSEKLPRLSFDEAYRYLGLPDTLSPQQQRMHVAGVIRQAQKDTFMLFNSALKPQHNLDAFRVFIMSRFDNMCAILLLCLVICATSILIVVYLSIRGCVSAEVQL